MPQPSSRKLEIHRRYPTFPLGSRLESLQARNCAHSNDSLPTALNACKFIGIFPLPVWFWRRSELGKQPAYRYHVWSYDFVADRTSDGRAIRMLTLIDEYSRECLAIDVARSLKIEDVLERLSNLFVRRGVPTYIRSR